MENVIVDVINSLNSWIGSEDFKTHLAESVGMPYDEIVAKIQEKNREDPGYVEKTVAELLSTFSNE